MRIHLDASAPAVAAAAELHDRYGAFLALHVGALPYPPDPDPARTPRARTTENQRRLVDSAEMVIGLDGQLSIRSGQTTTHALLVHNISDRPITINTNGNLTAVIVDPATGTAVGGFTGMQILPLIKFTAQPGQTSCPEHNAWHDWSLGPRATATGKRSDDAAAAAPCSSR